MFKAISALDWTFIADSTAPRGEKNCHNQLLHLVLCRQTHTKLEVNHRASNAFLKPANVCLHYKLRTHSGGGAGVEGVITKSSEEAGLSNTRISYQDDLEEAFRC